jgi:adenylosuccinate lyase
MKEHGADNDLLARIAADPAFATVRDEIPAMMEPSRFTGRSEAQVREFLDGEVAEVLARHADALAASGGDDVRV